MKSIKLYKASSFAYTPFDNFEKGDHEFLFSNNISFADSIFGADIIISQNIKKLKKYLWLGFFGKKFLIWTLEPRFDTNFTPIKFFYFGLIKVHFMNVYTKDVFCSNLSIHAKLINKKLVPIENTFKFNSKKVVALMSYYKGIDAPDLIKDGINIDLISLRSKICLYGANNNLMDVYGKGWPDGISKEDSREGDWPTRKKVLLSNYHFNLCFENTAAPNYMTEKIWDSIENYCLPIYYGKGTNAYELFPENSFIDYASFSSIGQLFDFISGMTKEEFVDRLNKCILVYNKISEQVEEFAKHERSKMLNSIVNKILNFL